MNIKTSNITMNINESNNLDPVISDFSALLNAFARPSNKNHQ